MAKFGLRLKNAQNDYTWLYAWNEYDALGQPVKPLMFNSIEEAEDYGQVHELPNFLIEPVNEDIYKSSKRQLNG
jgi:hypothetical protein